MSYNGAQFDEERQFERASGGDHAPTATNQRTTSTASTSSASILAELVKAMEPELLYKKTENNQVNTIINLATLQRMLLIHMQLEIIEEVGKLLGPTSTEAQKTTCIGGLKKTMAEFGTSS
jgi:hypothetical protein